MHDESIRRGAVAVGFPVHFLQRADEVGSDYRRDRASYHM
jgi:hypothetical protein